MKKITALIFIIFFPIVGNSQVKSISELEARPVIPFFSNDSDRKIKKHLYIIYEKNKNSSIDSLSYGDNTVLVFNLSKHIPKEKYNYGIMYDRNGKLGKFFRGTTSWGNEGKRTLVFHPEIHVKKQIKISDKFLKTNNILYTNDIENIEYETLRKVIEVSDIIDILVKKPDEENDYDLYRVRDRKK